ncbi:MAG: alpha/beta hydrolase [Solirubrobacterales bacterium]
MPYVTVGTENSADIQLHYDDHGSGRPIVLIHGYPLEGNSWEKQEPELLAAGYRVISYDRRGFGKSSQPTSGQGIKDTIAKDRYLWFEEFFKNFFNTDELAPERIGDAALRAHFQVAVRMSPFATYACVDTWLTDFRDDLPKIDVPTLVIHGEKDRILPFESTAARLRDENLIADLELVSIADGPHNISWTFPEEVNPALLSFLAG